MCNDRETSAFIIKKTEIDELLEQLTTASANFFDTDSEKVNWADVGSLGHVQQKLEELVAFINGK